MWVSQYVSPWKWTMLHSSTQHGLKHSSEGKSSQWTELETGYLGTHFVWEEKWPTVRIHVDSWTVVNCLFNFSGACKRKNWKIGVKESQRTGKWVALRERIQSVKFFVFAYWGSPESIHMEVALNNQVNRIIWPIMVEMEIMHGLTSTGSFTMADLGTTAAECPTCQPQRPMLSTWYIFQEDQWATW